MTVEEKSKGLIGDIWAAIPYVLQTVTAGSILLWVIVSFVRAPNFRHDFWIPLRTTLGYLIHHVVWYYVDVHKRWGPWKVSEPVSHFKFSLQSSWIVVLFIVGGLLTRDLYGMNIDSYTELVKWQFSDKYKFIQSKSLGEDVFWGILGFYCIDFFRYWGHRIGHYQFFYRTFPFSHAHHHNQIFINPLTTFMSPLLHFASLATYTPPCILGAMGNQRAAVIAWGICLFPNYTQHLGCDPLPWLTKINHLYFYGALPWIPMYHSYHHNLFIKAGNFGNTSVLFDYIFGTVQPECVYHIMNGEPLQKIKDRLESPNLDKILKSMYEANGGRNRLDLNPTGYDSSIWSLENRN